MKFVIKLNNSFQIHIQVLVNGDLTKFPLNENYTVITFCPFTPHLHFYSHITKNKKFSFSITIGSI